MVKVAFLLVVIVFQFLLVFTNSDNGKNEMRNSILLNAREAKGLTLKNVSTLTKIPITTISNWERAVCLPKGKRLKKIAELYSISVQDIRRSLPPDEAGYSRNGAAATQTLEVTMHESHWALAFELRPQFDAKDVSDLIAKLLIQAKHRATAP